MKFLLLLTLIVSQLSLSQNNSNYYELISNGSEYSMIEIKNAFETANLCGLFLQNNRNTIVLNDGSIIRIFSASELANSGLTVESDCISVEMTSKVSWSISSGVLLRRIEGAISPDNKINIIN